MKNLTCMMTALLLTLSTGAFAGNVPETILDQGMTRDPDMRHDSRNAFDDAMMKMHQKMSAVGTTGDVDTDFVNGMIPHHQGAVDMAKIELAKGKDPELKKLAADIIKAQKKEIAFMKKWLATHKVAQ